MKFLWVYRELLRNLVSRELKVRYRDSIVGVAWSLLSPLLMVAVFTFVFTVLLRSAPGNVPYPVFVLTAILAWNFSQISILAGIASITGNAGLISKVFFPREVLPISAALANAVNFLLATLVLLPTTIVFGISPSWLWLYFPLILLGQLLFTLGISLLVAAINVYYRDTQYIVEVMLLAWFFLTPIFYDISQIFSGSNTADLANLILLLNPLAAFVDDYRSIFLTHITPDPLTLARTILISILTWALGHMAFIRMSRNFGDIL